MKDNLLGPLDESIVHAAARELDAEGKKPSVVNVRDRLGRGSYTTVGKYLATYEGAGGDELGGSVPTMPDLVSDACGGIWRTAYLAALGEVEGRALVYREQAETARRELAGVRAVERELFESRRVVAQLESDLATVRADLSASYLSGQAINAERDRLLSILGQAVRAGQAEGQEVSDTVDASQASLPLDDSATVLTDEYAEVREEAATKARRRRAGRPGGES